MPVSSAPGPGGSTSSVENILWPDIWTDDQVVLFTEKYSWLSARCQKLGCTVCAGTKTILLSKEASRLSVEWVNFQIQAAGSNRLNQLSSLRSKMKQHEDSSSHKLAMEVFHKKGEKTIEKKLEKLSEKTLTKLCLLMRTAYSIAKNKRAYVEYEELVKLQELNGLDLGISLHSRNTATKMIDVIADEMNDDSLGI